MISTALLGAPICVEPASLVGRHQFGDGLRPCTSVILRPEGAVSIHWALGWFAVRNLDHHFAYALNARSTTRTKRFSPDHVR